MRPLSPSARKWFGGCVCLLVVAAAVLWRLGTGPSVETGRSPSFYDRVIAAPVASRPPARVATGAGPGDARTLQADATGLMVEPELAKAARQLNSPGLTVREDLEILELLLGAFQQLNGGTLPFGAENDEITAQLLGKNTAKIALMEPSHKALNERGQLLDRWGTPFYFHPLSRVEWELRSAGPDKTLFTEDDSVL